MSDPNLVLRMLRKLDSDLKEFRGEFGEFRGEVNERLDTLEHTVSGLASQLFFVTSFVKTLDRRVRKLEPRPK